MEPMHNAPMEPWANIPGGFDAAFAAAHALILDAMRARPEHAGMGTTLTALCIRDDVATIAHVGDSRCCLVRDGHRRQLTTDHANADGLINCLGVSRHSHLLTQFVGHRVRSGDVFVLHTDGLSDYMDEVAIAAMVQSMRAAKLASANTFPNDLAQMLVAQALRAGGADNVTVVVVTAEAE